MKKILFMIKSFCMKLKIIKDTNPKMRQRSKEVELPLSKYDQELLDSMLDYLVKSQDEEYAKKHNIRTGVGLAAIQVNELKRMFCVYIDDGENIVKYQLVNPKIIESSLKLAALSQGEGCLSVDNDRKGLAHRHYKIKMKAYDALTKEDIIIEAKGYLAIVLQHEYDHLDGLFYYDRFDKKDPMAQKSNEVLL